MECRLFLDPARSCLLRLCADSCRASCGMSAGPEQKRDKRAHAPFLAARAALAASIALILRCFLRRPVCYWRQCAAAVTLASVVSCRARVRMPYQSRTREVPSCVPAPRRRNVAGTRRAGGVRCRRACSHAPPTLLRASAGGMHERASACDSVMRGRWSWLAPVVAPNSATTRKIWRGGIPGKCLQLPALRRFGETKNGVKYKFVRRGALFGAN